jgi:arginase
MLRFTINNFRCMIGQKNNGVQHGGDMILHELKTGLIKKKLDIDITHIAINNYADYRKGYKAVKSNLNKGKFNINLGGDHSIAVSTIQPLLEKYKDDLLVLWIDAHADLNTFNSSLTQNMHGMPVGALTGLMDHWYTVHKRKTILKSENLIYIGIRDLDDFESKIINEKCIISFPNYTSYLVDYIKNHPAKHIHISCDIDSMEPSIMPSTGTPVPNGLTVNNVTNIINASKKRLVSFDLVEFNPLIGNRRQVKKTLTNISKILSKVI